MRDLFAHYYPPTGAEFEQLWTVGAIIPDANVLLNLYRYSNASRNEFSEVLRTLAERLWIPHQVALEFHRNRLKVIDDQLLAFDTVTKKLRDAKELFVADMGAFRSNESLDVDELLTRHASFTSELIEMVAASRKLHPIVPNNPDEDAIATLVTTLFKGKVGESYDSDQMEQLHQNGETRFKAKTPPGYKDAGKPEPERFGDLILWMQLLDHAKHADKDVLFITDDAKEDWWWRERGKTIGPRPELVKEFRERTGRRVHFYSPKQFLKRARDQFQAQISQSTYDEVEKVSAQDEAERRQDFANQSLLLEHLRARIESTQAEISALDVARTASVAQAKRMAQMQWELRRLESRKATLMGAIDSTDDEQERMSAIDSVIDIEAEIDQLVQMLVDGQEYERDIAGEKARLAWQLSTLKSELNSAAKEEIAQQWRTT